MSVTPEGAPIRPTYGRDSNTGLYYRLGGVASGGAGVTEHGLLTGLSADDHLQYARADGTRGNFLKPTGGTVAPDFHIVSADSLTFEADGRHNFQTYTGWFQFSGGNLDVAGRKITSLANGTATDDAVNKSQLDALSIAHDARYLQLTGGTLTGFVTAHSDPSSAMHLATKQYVDNKTPTLPPETDARANTGYGGNGTHTNPSGANNTAFGSGSQVAPQGQSNEAFGVSTQSSLTIGEFNSAIGSYAQAALTSGSYNMAMGRGSQYYMTTGSYNVAIGYGTQQSGVATTTASGQTAIGSESGAYAAGTGNNGTGIGGSSKYHTEATAIGFGAQARGVRSTAIGYLAVAPLDNQIMLGTAGERVDVPGLLYAASGVVVASGAGAVAATKLANTDWLWADITVQSNQVVKLQAGGTSGPTLIVNANGTVSVTVDPTAPLHLATKQYVDGKSSSYEVAGAVAAHDALTTAHANLRASAAPVNVSATVAAVGTSTLFARSDHKHDISTGTPVALGAANASGSSTSMARSDHVHIFPTKTDVGLGNVDNTSDANKPVSTAQATADGLRLLKAGDSLTGGDLTLFRDPTSAMHAATKQYVDVTSQGFSFKQAVRVASSTNVAAISGLLTIDGVTVVAGNRVLLAGQTTQSQNGIYIAAAGAWSRAPDADASGEIVSGTFVPVAEGTTWSNSQAMCTGVGTAPWVPGTNISTWTRYGSASDVIGGLGIRQTGNTMDIVSTTADLTVAANDITIVSAPKWTTGRTVTLTGEVTGVSAAWDGSANISFATAIATGVIVDADVNASAAIATSKISGLDTALTAKAPLASPTFTGIPAAPTAAAATNTTQLATTAFVTTADNLKANLASPTFTGVPAAPTASVGTNTTQLATTAFVLANGTSLTTTDARYLQLTGGTLTGNVTMSQTLPGFESSLRINRGDSSKWGFILWQTGGTNKWSLGMTGDTTEKFGIHSEITGNWALTIDPATDLITVKGDPTAALGIATKQYVDNKTPPAAPNEVVVAAVQPSDPAVEWWVDTATSGVSPSWMIWTGTRAAYDAIGTKDSMTLYVITG